MAAEQRCARAVQIRGREEMRHPVAVYPHQRRGISLYEEDMESLKPHVYLNDQIVNYVLRTFTMRPDGEPRYPNIRSLDSQFMAEATRGLTGDVVLEMLEANIVTLRRWYRRGGPFDVPCVLVPVCEGQHWYLLMVLRTAERTVVVHVLDSLGHGVRNHAATVLAQVVGGMVEPAPTVVVGHLPARRQPNLTDCGLYTLHHARALVDVLRHGGDISEGMLTGAFEGPVLSRSEVITLIEVTGQPGATSPPLAIHAPEPVVTVASDGDAMLEDRVSLHNRRSGDWRLEVDALLVIARLVQKALERLTGSGHRRDIFSYNIQGERIKFRVFRRAAVTARVTRA